MKVESAKVKGKGIEGWKVSVSGEEVIIVFNKTSREGGDTWSQAWKRRVRETWTQEKTSIRGSDKCCKYWKTIKRPLWWAGAQWGIWSEPCYPGFCCHSEQMGAGEEHGVTLTDYHTPAVVWIHSKTAAGTSVGLLQWCRERWRCPAPDYYPGGAETWPDSGCILKMKPRGCPMICKATGAGCIPRFWPEQQKEWRSKTEEEAAPQDSEKKRWEK